MADHKKADRGWRREIIIDRRYEGPTDLTLGGYISGIMAVHLDANTVEVTMRVIYPILLILE